MAVRLSTRVKSVSSFTFPKSYFNPMPNTLFLSLDETSQPRLSGNNGLAGAIPAHTVFQLEAMTFCVWTSVVPVGGDGGVAPITALATAPLL